MVFSFHSLFLDIKRSHFEKKDIFMFSPHSISIYEYWTEYILCRRMLHYVCDVFSSLAVLLPIYYNLDLDIESLCRNISRVFSQMQCRELHDHSYYTYRLIFDCSGLSWHEVLDYTCIFFFQNLMMKIFLEDFVLSLYYCPQFWYLSNWNLGWLFAN